MPYLTDAIPPLGHALEDTMSRAQQRDRRKRIRSACKAEGLKVIYRSPRWPDVEAYAQQQRAALIKHGIDEYPWIGSYTSI